MPGWWQLQSEGWLLPSHPVRPLQACRAPEAHKDGRKVEEWVLIVKNALWLHTWPCISFYFWLKFFFKCLQSWASVINVCSLNHLSHLYTNKSVNHFSGAVFFILIWKQSRISLEFYHFHFNYLLLPWNKFQSTRFLRIWESRENPQKLKNSHGGRPQPGTRYAESRRSPNTGSISPSGSDSVKPAQTSLHFSLHLLCKWQRV